MEFLYTTITSKRNVRDKTLKYFPYINNSVAFSSPLKRIHLEVREAIPVIQLVKFDFSCEALLDCLKFLYWTRVYGTP